MVRTLSHKRYMRFVETAALGELGLLAFVGLVCFLFGSRSVQEVGTALLVAGFGASLLGVSSVMREVQNGKPAEGRFTLPSGVHGVDPSLSAAMNVSRETFELFWFTVAVSAMSFFLGTVLTFLS